MWSSLQDQRMAPAGPPSWMGSQIEEMRDASGLMYRRNRYYDPSTGRFTQEDPIGIAGGINMYGYADGDPVSFEDPYGLSAENGPCDWAQLGECIKQLGAAITVGFAAGLDASSRMVDGLSQFLVREGSIQVALAVSTEGAGNVARSVTLVSKIREVPALARIAGRLGGTAEQVGVDAMTSRLAAGNMNPGLGHSYLFAGIHEARAANGGRVYFRSSGEVVEVLAKSDKGSQDQVIRILRQVYGR